MTRKNDPRFAFWRLVSQVTKEVREKEDRDRESRRARSESDHEMGNPESQGVQVSDRTLDDWMGPHIRS